MLEQTRFDAITTKSDHVKGFSTHAGTIEAYVVALAADSGAKSLEEALGAFLSVATSSVILMHLDAPGHLVNQTLPCLTFKIRQIRMVAEDCLTNANQEDEDAKAGQTLQGIKYGLHGADGLKLRSSRIGQHPIPADDFPIVRLLPQTNRLYAAVMRAGVTLAAVIREFTMTEILMEKEPSTPCRPERFLAQA